MEHLQILNQYRIDAERNYSELEQIRDRHINSLSRVDSKMNDYYGIINAIRTEMNLLIVKEEINISVEVLNLNDAEDTQVLMAKIDIPSFPPIYKSFFGITNSLFQISGNESLNDFSIQGRIKELAIEWLKEKEEYAVLFNQPFNDAKQIIDRFINDDSILHYLKRKPIML